MRLISSIVCAILAIFGNGDCDDFKVVHTSDGDVRGIKNTTKWQNVPYYAFKGIPYALPPVGDLRFKAPKPNKPWAPKVWDGTKFGNICPQLGQLFPSSYPQSEDCLYLNVYVPECEDGEKLPVLFYIHGGGYGEGSGNDNYYGPDFSIEKRVILVTFNYRLGILGLMSLNLPEYSGNMQLKDQQLALKWIHKNIEYFNGDNQRITIIGQSSGAACANFHVLSEESRKYFQNSIQMSGVATLYWAMSDYNDHLDIAHEIAQSTGNDTTNTTQLVEYLKSESVDYLLQYGSIWALMTDRTFLVLFTPVIERKDAVDAFMTEKPEVLYETQDIQVNSLITHTSAEMLIVVIKELPKMFDIEGLNTNFTLTLPFKNLNLSTDSEPYRKANEDIRQFYFENQTITSNMSATYVDMLSDINMVYAIYKAAKLHASKSKGQTYFVEFAVNSKLNIFKLSGAQVYSPGACHCDDLCYLFRVGIGEKYYDDVFAEKNDEQSETSIRTIQDITNLFTNFAKIDKMSDIGFKSMQDGEFNYLSVTNKGMMPGTNPNAKAMAFWTELEKKMQPYIKA